LGRVDLPRRYTAGVVAEFTALARRGKVENGTLRTSSTYRAGISENAMVKVFAKLYGRHLRQGVLDRTVAWSWPPHVPQSQQTSMTGMSRR
jgi:hypothetical protein